ncbi:hypothetical protein P171DRAFT_375775 [Karstenula rhodostoma CBS 690.94]|uniref:CUE domain-containing protein n=1 Tax=Karstenula rhodostoma CBS 690.94 TaxID=1392251 RepID=A0A9P4PWI5_9PLEO|nr:hypothetical protein P171DRAFT_375775 [Karstenula rhodostoma CBS 690.94]
MSEKAIDEKPPKLGSGSGHESPTTARELDFDDDDEALAAPGEQATAPPPPSKSPKPGVRFSDDATEIPPAKPPRPVSPRQTATTTLIEAFPNTDPTTVRGILMASDWNADKAFDVLLRLSDPNFKDEEAPPPKPPRPAQPTSQVEKDAEYARRLTEQYRSQGYDSRSRGDPRQPRQQPRKESHGDEDQGLFNKDDLDEIKRNLEQGFDGARNTINKWVGGFMKKLEGEPQKYDQYGNEVYRHNQRQDFGPSQSDQLRGIRRSAEARRSADHNRYDNDNRMLDDDFEALELRDDESHPNQRSNRPLANPDLFKPTPVSPPQSGPVDEVDALYRNPSPNGQQTGVTGNKSGGKKWQPLTSVAPHPESDEHDPFSLGDSDDEEAKTKDIKAEDTERLKKAAEAKKVDETAPARLTPAGRSGSVGQKDAAAEALLKEAK